MRRLWSRRRTTAAFSESFCASRERFRIVGWAAGFGLLCVVLTACGASKEERQALDEDSIDAALVKYLPYLAEAYKTGDTDPLAGMAAPREIASVEKRIADILAVGRVLAPEFHRLTIEDVNVWSHSNAYVTTLEVWDLRTYAAGSDTVLAEELENATRVKYQLQREDDQWLILFRAIQQ